MKSRSQDLFKALLRLKEPHEVLSERVEELFDLHFQTADIGDTSDVNEGQSTLSKQKSEISSPIFKKELFQSSSRKTELPPLIKTAKFGGDSRIQSAFSRNSDQISKKNNGLPSFNKELSAMMSNRLQRENIRQNLSNNKLSTFNDKFITDSKIGQKKQSFPKLDNQRCISPKNCDFLLDFFSFLAELGYANGDEFLINTLSKALKVISLYEFKHFIRNDQQRLSILQKIFKSINTILENKNISIESTSMIKKFLMSSTNEYSLLSLVASAIEDDLDSSTPVGLEKITLLLCQLPLIEKLNFEQRSHLLKCLIGKTQTEENKFDILTLFKLKNKQLLLLLLAQLMTREQFATLDKHNVKEIMGVCLKAVSHYFEGKKNFESLTIYLKLAFKVFIQIKDKVMQEFVIYFLMKTLHKDQNIISPEQLTVFMDLYLESINYLIKNQKQEDNQMILEAYETLALFTIEFNSSNKALFQILKEQGDPVSKPNLKKSLSLPTANKNDETDYTIDCKRIYDNIRDYNLNPIFINKIIELMKSEEPHGNKLISLTFFANLVRYFNEINFEKSYQSNQKLKQFNTQLLSQKENEQKKFTDIFLIILKLGKVLIDQLYQQPKLRNNQLVILKHNIQTISQKLFNNFGILCSEDRATAEKLTQKQEFKQVFMQYLEFVIHDVSKLTPPEKYGEIIVQNYITEPLTKNLKKVQFMRMFPECAEILVECLVKQMKKVTPFNQYENLFKIFWSLLTVLSYHLSEINMDQHSQWLRDNNIQHDEDQAFAKVLESVYNLMIIMGAPKCFTNEENEQKNHKEIMHLWAHILLFIQRKESNQKLIQPQINKLASISSYIIFDQDFIIKMRITSQKFRDLNEILKEKENYFAKYPQVHQNFLQIVGGVTPITDKPNIQSPSKTEIIKKVEKAKLRKSQKIEEETKHEELKEDHDEELDDDPVEQNTVAQQLNNNEILFITLFILINESRVNFLQSKIHHKNLRCMQNFVQAVLVIFQSHQIDQENIQTYLESIVKVQIVEYIEQIYQCSKNESQSQNLSEIICQDIQNLIKAIIDINQRVSNVAKFMLKKYMDAFPLILREQKVQNTLLDSVHLLSETLQRQYTSMSEPKQLKITGLSVTIPSCTERIKQLLSRLVSIYSDLFLFAAIFDKQTVNKNYQQYKAQFGTQGSDFHLKLHEGLNQNLCLSKFENSKNLLKLKEALVFDAKSFLNEVETMKRDHGLSCFYHSQLNQQIFELGGIQSVQDSSQSLSKIIPFSLRNETTLEFSEINPAIKNQLESQINDLKKIDKLSQDQAIDRILFDLQSQFLFQLMKIDIAGQIKSLQKRGHGETLLKAIVIEQLKLQELQLVKKVDKLNFQNKAAKPIDTEPAHKIQLIKVESKIETQSNQSQDAQSGIGKEKDQYIENKLKQCQIMMKILQEADQVNYIKKKSNKVSVITEKINIVLGIMSRENIGNFCLKRQQISQMLLSQLSLVMEESLVDVIQISFLRNSSYQSRDKNLIFINCIDQFIQFLEANIEQKKSLKSKPKYIKQSMLINQFNQNMNTIQEYELINNLFQQLDQYDDQFIKVKLNKDFSKDLNNRENVRDDDAVPEKSFQSSLIIVNESLKCSVCHSQQISSTKLLKCLEKWFEMLMDQHYQQLADFQYKANQKIIDSYIRLLKATTQIILDFAHKKDFTRVALKAIKFGLLMSKTEQRDQQSQNQIICHSLNLLTKLIQKKDKIILVRENLSKLKEELQLIEDIKYLIPLVNKDSYLMCQHFNLKPIKHKSQQNLFMMPRADYRNIGVKMNFIEIKDSYDDFLIVQVKEKYKKCLEPNSKTAESFINNLLVDQLNMIRYALLGNNFYQKQMMDIQVKFKPLVTPQMLRDKFEILLYNEPKLLETVIQLPETFKAIIVDIFKQSFLQKDGPQILRRVFWKSEKVLEILMKQAIEIRDIEQDFIYQKLLTLWRNKYVSRMVCFVGYKYSSHHFLHSIALKPFYASSSKITIFYLSQFFQSLRWDTNFQLHRLLLKKSQTMPSIAHNVIWFCKVESFSDGNTQHQRKVPLPCNENLDVESKKLEKLIYSKMTKTESEYFNTETEFLEKITSISGVLKPSQSKDEKKAIIREKLIQYNQEIPDNVYLPTNQRCRVVGIVTSSGMPMQSAARVPILVSFEVQEYEGPDQDPTLSKGKHQISNDDQKSLQKLNLDAINNSLRSIQVSEMILFEPFLQNNYGNQAINQQIVSGLIDQEQQQIKQILDGLVQCLSKLNNDKHYVQTIQENLSEILDNEFQLQSNWFQNIKQGLNADERGNSFNIQRNLNLQKNNSIKDRVAKISQQPALKIKMSQYMFQTRQNPMIKEEEVSYISNKSSAKEPHTSTKERVKQRNSVFQSFFNQQRASRLQKIEEMESEILNESQLERQNSDVSDSDGAYNFGKLQMSPYKSSLIRKNSVRRKSLMKFQIGPNIVGGPSFSQLARHNTFSQQRLRGSHHLNYRPTIFKKESDGIRFVLQFEQQIIQQRQNQREFNQILAGLENSNVIETSQNRRINTAVKGPIKDPNKPMKIVSCIFKVNDDLRQDILALQFIKLFQKIFKKCDLDLIVAPYKCISNRTGDEQLLGGIIEVVPNSSSRDQIGKAFEIDLYDYFLKKYGNESSKEFMQARLNFIKSLAAYSVVSFILQIKDRHNGNILVDEQGCIVHIDFGFIFDWSPGKDMKFESANFKMTKEFIKILGGNAQAEPYQLWVQKTIQGYLAVREHYREFANLLELMIYSGFPCFKPVSLQTLQQRFRMEGDCTNQFEAAIYMRSIIEDAHDKWTTTAYDMIQYKQNKIVF